MKTITQLEQEAKQAREVAAMALAEVLPYGAGSDIADKLILAAVAMVTYQFALGMEDADQIWNESGTKVISEKLPEVLRGQEERDSDNNELQEVGEITESQLSLLKDIFDYDDEWLMRHISIKLLGHRNIVLEIDHINDCDYKELEALQEVSADSDGWIVWNGGICPVDSDLYVFVKFRNGGVADSSQKAGLYKWDKCIADPSWDIVAYKVGK